MDEKIQVLYTAKEYLEKMKGGIDEAINAFQAGEEARALSFMPYIFDGLQWLIEVISLTSSVHKGKIEIDSITEKLQKMGESFENCDYILVSDLLEYEILPILNTWYNEINSILVV